MLLVPTVVRPSPISGVGLFTLVPISADTRIWAFDDAVDWRLTREQLEAFPEPWLARLREWSYEEPDGSFVLCGDNAKFMNHAFEPNCLDVVPDATVALRDIEAGEELTCDYRVVDAESARSGLAQWNGRDDPDDDEPWDDDDAWEPTPERKRQTGRPARERGKEDEGWVDDRDEGDPDWRRERRERQRDEDAWSDRGARTNGRP